MMDATKWNVLSVNFVTWFSIWKVNFRLICRLFTGKIISKFVRFVENIFCLPLDLNTIWIWCIVLRNRDHSVRFAGNILAMKVIYLFILKVILRKGLIVVMCAWSRSSINIISKHMYALVNNSNIVFREIFVFKQFLQVGTLMLLHIFIFGSVRWQQMLVKRKRNFFPNYILCKILNHVYLDIKIYNKLNKTLYHHCCCLWFNGYYEKEEREWGKTKSGSTE